MSACGPVMLPTWRSQSLLPLRTGPWLPGNSWWTAAEETGARGRPTPVRPAAYGAPSAWPRPWPCQAPGGGVQEGAGGQGGHAARRLHQRAHTAAGAPPAAQRSRPRGCTAPKDRLQYFHSLNMRLHRQEQREQGDAALVIAGSSLPQPGAAPSQAAFRGSPAPSWEPCLRVACHNPLMRAGPVCAPRSDRAPRTQGWSKGHQLRAENEEVRLISRLKIIQLPCTAMAGLAVALRLPVQPRRCGAAPRCRPPMQTQEDRHPHPTVVQSWLCS